MRGGKPAGAQGDMSVKEPGDKQALGEVLAKIREVEELVTLMAVEVGAAVKVQAPALVV